MAGNCCTRSGFSNVQHYSDEQSLTKLQKNIKEYLNWSFLNIGAWSDIIPPGDASILQCVKCPGYDDGQVFQAFRGDWVWETVNYTDNDNIIHSPIIPTFNQTPDAINWDAGQLIFNGGLGTTATVEGSFSTRCVNIEIAGECGWWKEYEKGSWDVTDWIPVDGVPCGCWNISQNKVQLPAIIISGFPTSSKLEGLGGCYSKKEITIDLYVIAETEVERSKIVDILISDKGSCLSLFDPQAIPCNLDCNGLLAANPLTYPEMIDNSCSGQTTLSESSSFGFSFLECGLYEGIVRQEYVFYL